MIRIFCDICKEPINRYVKRYQLPFLYQDCGRIKCRNEECDLCEKCENQLATHISRLIKEKTNG